jgi:hypothetical protein
MSKRKGAKAKRERRQSMRRWPTFTCDQLDALYTPLKPRERVVADPARQGSLPRMDAASVEQRDDGHVVVVGERVLAGPFATQASAWHWIDRNEVR